MDIIFFIYFFYTIHFFKYDNSNQKNLVKRLAFIYMSIGLISASLTLVIIGFYNISLTSLRLAIWFLGDFSFSISSGLFALLVLTYFSASWFGKIVQNKKYGYTTFFSAMYGLCIFISACLIGSVANLFTNFELDTDSHFWKPLLSLVSIGSLPSFVLGGMAGHQFSKKSST